jgi:hypothetical protein
VNHAEIWRNLDREEKTKLLLDKNQSLIYVDKTNWKNLPYIVKKNLELSKQWPKKKPTNA